MNEVFFEVLSPLPLSTNEEARRLLKVWAETAPNFLPDRWGHYEPLRKRFSLAAMNDILKSWEFQCLFKKTVAPKLDASVFMQYGPHRRHSIWKITLHNLRDFDQTCFSDLLRLSASTLSADFGFIHHLTKTEVVRNSQNGSISYLDVAKTRTNLFVTTHTLKRFIPDIYWTTLFGLPYVRLISRDRLVSAPVYHVEELNGGAIALQLTPKLEDVVNDELAFEQLRKLVRDHLNCDAFFDQDKGLNHRYMEATFRWAPILQ